MLRRLSKLFTCSWKIGNVNYPVEAFPLELRTAVTQGQSAQQRFDYKGKPYVAVGVDDVCDDGARRGRRARSLAPTTVVALLQ